MSSSAAYVPAPSGQEGWCGYPASRQPSASRPPGGDVCHGPRSESGGDSEEGSDSTVGDDHRAGGEGAGQQFPVRVKTILE